LKRSGNDGTAAALELHLRARVRQVQAWLRSDLMPIRLERPTPTIFYRPVPSPLSLAAQIASRKLRAGAAELLSHGGENLFGHWVDRRRRSRGHAQSADIERR
jgi:hypothetical protein